MPFIRDISFSCWCSAGFQSGNILGLVIVLSFPSFRNFCVLWMIIMLEYSSSASHFVSRYFGISTGSHGPSYKCHLFNLLCIHSAPYHLGASLLVWGSRMSLCQTHWNLSKANKCIWLHLTKECSPKTNFCVEQQAGPFLEVILRACTVLSHCLRCHKNSDFH